MTVSSTMGRVSSPGVPGEYPGKLTEGTAKTSLPSSHEQLAMHPTLSASAECDIRRT